MAGQTLGCAHPQADDWGKLHAVRRGRLEWWPGRPPHIGVSSWPGSVVFVGRPTCFPSEPRMAPRPSITPAGPIAVAFRRCTASLAGSPSHGGRSFEHALERLDRSRSAAPLQTLARRIGSLADPAAQASPEVVVFLGLLAEALPDQPQPALALALALVALRAPKAEQSLVTFEQRFGVHGASSLALGRIRLERGAAREALADFERALASRTETAQALFGQGLAWLALAEPARAADALARAHERAPQDDAVAFHHALALGRSGAAQAALAILDELVARQPDHAKAWFEMGNLLQDAGRHAEAAAAFGQALVADPTLASAAFNRAVSLLEERDMDQAMTEFGRAIRLDASSAGPVAQALTRAGTGCLWLDARRMAQDLSGGLPGA